MIAIAGGLSDLVGTSSDHDQLADPRWSPGGPRRQGSMARLPSHPGTQISRSHRQYQLLGLR